LVIDSYATTACRNDGHPRRSIIMRKTMIACLAMLLLAVAQANGHSKGVTQQQAHAALRAEIRRQNYAKQEAVRLLFGPQGLPALTRPSDPWNYNRSRYFYRPNYNRNEFRAYYR
jgi:hypothetical protein